MRKSWRDTDAFNNFILRKSVSTVGRSMIFMVSAFIYKLLATIYIKEYNGSRILPILRSLRNRLFDNSRFAPRSFLLVRDKDGRCS